MEKTNFTFVPTLRWMLGSLLIFLGFGVSAQSITCNNSVQASIDPTLNSCQVELTADMILEGSANGTYNVKVVNGIQVVYDGPAPALLTNLQDHLGESLTVTITDVNSQNSCWGALVVEDKLPPVIDCGTPVNVDCNDPLPTIEQGIILGGVNANDNCDTNPDIQLINEVVVDNDLCDDNQKTVIRTFVAFDAWGNESAPCDQTITINRIAPVFPVDREWDCTAYENNINLITPAFSGSPLSGDFEACNYAVTHSDVILPTCGYTASTSEPVFKIVRTWTVLDWCTGNVITMNGSGDNIQIIKVTDTTPPSVTIPAVTASANVPGSHPHPCVSTDFIPAPGVMDDCTEITSLQIFTPAGELNYLNNNPLAGGFIPSPGLGLGDHTGTVVATDRCGNVSELPFTISVIDDINPVAICDEITDVNLSSDGQAVVYATTFDDGSYDNCCLDEFLVRRMDAPSAPFEPSVTFTCSDMGTTVMVVFKAVDCDDNENTCMVEVQVDDKLPPFVTSCPGDFTITCDEYWDNYEAAFLLCEDDDDCEDGVFASFGSPTFFDNCGFEVEVEVDVDLDQCGVGEITREWTATDEAGNAPAECDQTITVEHVSDWAVVFPDDKFVECGNEVPDFGEPELFYETCELLAVSHENEMFTNIPDACFKLVRTWTVINWCTVGNNIDNTVIERSECDAGLTYVVSPEDDNCQLNDPVGNADLIVGANHRTFRENQGHPNETTTGTTEQDGYITYQQVIKVNDIEAPEFENGCEIEDMCIYDGCTRTITLPLPDVTDCVGEEFTTVEVESTSLSAILVGEDGSGPYSNIPPGTYTVTYKATDNCGNWEVCQTEFDVIDCKNPTPYCVDGLIIGIMNTEPPMVDVWADDFDAGSFDNCGVKAISFSADINDTQRVYDCDDLGEQTIQLWVTDIYDNQDFCETFVVIQDQMGVCGDGLVAGGAIANEDDSPVEDVMVELSGQSNGMVMTDNMGNFNFNIPTGNDITITPSKDTDPLNGVTTYDIVLISKHILGSQLLDSPYKMIAADANHSESITTFDIVSIRKLILQISSNFPNNTSWRFIDKDHDFANAANPWATAFPEVINFNNVASTILDADFVAVKIGDVNMSAATQNLLGADDRNTVGTFTLNAEDRLVKAGETVTVEFTANQEVQGYQFTINLSNAINFVEMTEGVAKEDNFGFALLNENAITTSWNGAGIEGQTAFAMTFTANSDILLSEALTANSRFTAAEAYNTNGDVMDVELNFNQVASNFELYQNSPNPFDGETVIGFNLPEAGTATLTVADVSGKVLTVITGEYAKGYNQVQISNLPATGVMYYTLATANETATKKMVATK